MSEAVPAAASDRRHGTVGASERAQAIVGRRALRAMMTRKDGPGLLFLGRHLGLILLTGIWIHHAMGSWAVVPAVFLHGIVIVHLFAPLHECSHGTAFKTKWLNDAIYWMCALTLGLAPLHFKLQHADHHSYTQDVERDPQMIVMGERLWGYLYYASAIPYFKDIVSVLVRHALGRFSDREKRYVHPNARKAVQRDAWIMWGVYGSVLAASLATGSWAALIYWLVPRIVAEPVERIIRLSEHNGCARSPDMLENTRTILTSRPVRWLSWNMPLHAAHHVAPQVPFHAIPALSEVLRPQLREVRHGYPKAVAYQLSRLIDNGRRQGGDVPHGRAAD